MPNSIYAERVWSERFVPKRVADAADEKRVATITNMVPEDAKCILDVGIGGGYIYRRFQQVDGARCFGIDISIDLVKSARDRHLCVGDASKLPFRDGEFDLVLAADVIEHIREEAFLDAASEMARVSGKYLLINSPYKDAIGWPVSFCSKCGKEFNIYGHMRSVDMGLVRRVFPQKTFEMLKSVVFGKKRDGRPSFLVYLARRYGKVYSTEGAICPYCENTDINHPPRNAAQRLLGKVICAFFAISDRIIPSAVKDGSEMCVLLKKREAVAGKWGA